MKHTETKVIKSLSKKHDCSVDPFKRQVIVVSHPKKKSDLGNKSLGKIDFLVNHCNYKKKIINIGKKPVSR